MLSRIFHDFFYLSHIAVTTLRRIKQEEHIASCRRITNTPTFWSKKGHGWEDVGTVGIRNDMDGRMWER